MTELVVGLGDELFSVVRPWGELPPGMQLRDVSDVAVDSHDHVYVYQRGDPPIVVFDASGGYLRSLSSSVCQPEPSRARAQRATWTAKFTLSARWQRRDAKAKWLKDDESLCILSRVPSS